MSRVGRKVIVVPSNVKVSVKDTEIEVQGPKGKLTTPVPPGISFALAGKELTCKRSNDERQQRAFHGMARALAQNAIKGVTEGFSKDLDIVGVGYRAAVEGNKAMLALGFSHPVVIEAEEGITFEVPTANKIVVSGIDNQRVGQVAADIRKWRKPEPYKGKGIRYEGEHVRRKLGKAAK